MMSSGGVTSSCEFQSTVSLDGQFINVIDTPGLFDFSGETEVIGKEIVKCINLAQDGIHAFLVVFSARTRFSREEEAVVKSLCDCFGSKLADYVIVVFTGGDELEESEVTLDEYLGGDCPEPLKEVLQMCGNRKVLFDNKTRELLRLVNTVVEHNGGRPYYSATTHRDAAVVESSEEYRIAEIERASWIAETDRALSDAKEVRELRMEGKDTACHIL